MILALVSNNTASLLVVIPNSSIAALPSLSLLLISWLQSQFELMTEPSHTHESTKLSRAVEDGALWTSLIHKVAGSLG